MNHLADIIVITSAHTNQEVHQRNASYVQRLSENNKTTARLSKVLRTSSRLYIATLPGTYIYLYKKCANMRV